MRFHFERYGLVGPGPPLVNLQVGADGRFQVGSDGVLAILAPQDQKVEFICFAEKTLCYVRSAMGYPALYPLEPVSIERPIKAVLMDLDGTSVRSEEFWIWVIERAAARLVNHPQFRLKVSDLPHVSGHSVSEHLQHCIATYAPGASLVEARAIYYDIVRTELEAIRRGHGQAGAFQPAPGLKSFLLALKESNIKIGLVTSGLHEKAWPEIVSAFRTLELGDPSDFYDAIITAGYPLRGGQPGTLGELEPKPHPWLYAETARVGLGLDYVDRHSVVGIEDSAAGVVSIRLAGFSVIGLAGGTIEDGGAGALCSHFCQSLDDVAALLL